MSEEAKPKEKKEIEEITINNNAQEEMNNQIGRAQEEMKIISEFAINNTKLIMQSRSFFIVALTALIGFILEKNRHELFLVVFLLIILAAATEFIITFSQNDHINRLWQLDNAINKSIMSDQKKAHNIFFRKETRCFLQKIWNVFMTPSYSIFYILSLLLVLFLILFVWKSISCFWLATIKILILILILFIIMIIITTCRSFKE